MTTYIFFDAALQIFVNAYSLSVVLLLLASTVGLAAIETFEKANSKGLGDSF